jgi:predicted DNA-binding transcriptional regulator AlpA
VALIQLKEVARRAGCSPSRIRKLRLLGRTPKDRGMMGQTYVFDEAEIEAWLPGRKLAPPGRTPKAEKGK